MSFYFVDLAFPPGRAGSTTWASDLGLTFPLVSQEDMPLLGSGSNCPIRIAFQLQLQPLSCWEWLGEEPFVEVSEGARGSSISLEQATSFLKLLELEPGLLAETLRVGI